MRLKLLFRLSKPELPIEYRRVFLSFIKSTFENGSKDIYEKFYNKESVMKPFTFGVYLPNPNFKEENIELKGDLITVNFSTSSMELGIEFYNCLLQKKFKPYPLPNGNQMAFQRISMVKEKSIKEETLVIKTLSPLLVRQHNRDTNEDRYLMPEDKEFLNQFTQSTENILNRLTGNPGTVIIEPIRSKTRKIPVKHYGRILEASSGMFILSGSPGDLEFLYKVGIGSRRSEGFGMFEIVG